MYKSDSEENARKRIKLFDEIEGSYMRKKKSFKIADIVYITHYQKGSVLHLCREKEKPYTLGNIIVPYNFKQLLELLNSDDFSVPHNSYIVNLHYVSNFNPETETLVADGKELPMSRGKKGNFLNDLMGYMERKRENERLRKSEKQDKEYILNCKYYVWLINYYLEEKQYEKIKDVLTKLQMVLNQEGQKKDKEQLN